VTGSHLAGLHLPVTYFEIRKCDGGGVKSLDWLSAKSCRVIEGDPSEKGGYPVRWGRAKIFFDPWLRPRHAASQLLPSAKTPSQNVGGKWRKCLKLLVGATGFEPATPSPPD
jgi:hypothetical protein